MHPDHVIRRTTARQVAFALLLAGVAAGIATAAEPTEPAAPAEPVERTIAVDTHRPLSAAVTLLQARHGWLMTYEDPAYVHASDVVDATEQVRQDLDQYPPGQAPKVLVPRAAALEVHYRVASDLPARANAESALKAALAAHMRADNPGRFHLLKAGRYIHVVPDQVKDETGKWQPTASLLDAQVILPAGQGSTLDVLAELCRHLSDATGAHVELGTTPINLLARHECQLTALEGSARTVLTRVLDEVGDRFVWQLLYDPGLKWHVLNIQWVEAPPTPE